MYQTVKFEVEDAPEVEWEGNRFRITELDYTPAEYFHRDLVYPPSYEIYEARIYDERAGQWRVVEGMLAVRMQEDPFVIRQLEAFRKEGYH